MWIETRYLFYRSSDSFESYYPLRGLRATQRRSALEGTTKVTLARVFSNSFFSFHWLISRRRNRPLQTFWGTPQSLGCSLAMPNRLGPKSPRVTNANHEIDNMHKCSSGWIALFFNFSQPTNWFGNLDHTLTKRGFGRVGKAQKRVCVWAELAASKGGGLGVFIAPLKN